MGYTFGLNPFHCEDNCAGKYLTVVVVVGGEEFIVFIELIMLHLIVVNLVNINILIRLA
jgi:hypothetical protein